MPQTKTTWKLSFLAPDLVFYACQQWADHCEFVDSRGQGWSTRKRALVQHEAEFRDLPYDIKYG